MVWIALAATFLTAVFGAVAGAGAASAARRHLGPLVYLATGALLGITVFDIFPESRQVLSWPGLLVAAVGGFALLGAINRYVFQVCPACGIAHLDHDRLKHDNRAFSLLALALGAHCLLDGMAVAAGSNMSGKAGLGVTLGMLVHKLPEGFALALLIVNLGAGAWTAFWRSAAIQSATLAGGVLGLFALDHAAPKAFIGATFAFVGGGFLFLVINAIAGLRSGQTVREVKTAVGLQAASFAMTGALFALASRAG